MTPARAARTLVVGLLVVGLLVVLAACAPSIDTELDVKEDGTADVRIDMAVELPTMLQDMAEGNMAEELTGDIEEGTAEIAEIAGVAPEDVTVETSEGEDGFGIAVAVAGVPLERVPAVLAAPPAEDEPAPPFFEELTVTAEGDDYRVSGSLAPLRSVMDMAREALDEAPDGGEMDAMFDEMLDEMLGEIMGDASLAFSLRLPGTVSDHNADEVTDDGVLVWEAEPEVPKAVNAESSTDPPLALLLTVGAAVVVLVVVGAVVVAVVRRNRAGEGSQSEMPDVPQAPQV